MTEQYQKLVEVIYEALDGDVSGSQAHDVADAVMEHLYGTEDALAKASLDEKLWAILDAQRRNRRKPAKLTNAPEWFPGVRVDEHGLEFDNDVPRQSLSVPGRVTFTVLEKG